MKRAIKAGTCADCGQIDVEGYGDDQGRRSDEWLCDDCAATTPCACCGERLTPQDGRTIHLVRDQDRGSCDALGSAMMSCRSYLWPVRICDPCDDARIIPDGYFDLAAKGGAL